MSSASCSWMSQYVLFPNVIDQFSHPGVLCHYVMCVAFILEYSLQFFMQHKVLEVTYFFPYVCTSCMYVSVLFSNGPLM